MKIIVVVVVVVGVGGVWLLPCLLLFVVVVRVIVAAVAQEVHSRLRLRTSILPSLGRVRDVFPVRDSLCFYSVHDPVILASAIA